MRVQRGSRRTLSLTSVLGGVGVWRHAPAVLLPGKRRGTHCIWGWMGPRVGLDGCGKSLPRQNSIAGPPSPPRFAIPTAVSWPTNVNWGPKYLHFLLWSWWGAVFFPRHVCGDGGRYGEDPDFVLVPEKNRDLLRFSSQLLSSEFVCVRTLRVTYCYAAPALWRM